MKNLHNVEKSVFRPGEYVGYADGVWRIVRYSKIYRAIHRDGKYWTIEGRTLAEVSQRLSEVK